MTRIHDMGGRFGDGPVQPEREDGPVFHQDWQARALAVTLAAGALGQWNLDRSRHARECLSPQDYAAFGYYEKWLAGLADLLVETGLLSRDELRQASGSAASGASPEALDPRALRSATPPAFAPGQAVRSLRPAANRLSPGGHTRLPAYAAGARGRVLRCHGAHVLPDSNAHGLGEAPEPLYAVAFPAAELWAAPEHPQDEVVLDLWQSYLEPA